MNTYPTYVSRILDKTNCKFSLEKVTSLFYVASREVNQFQKKQYVYFIFALVKCICIICTARSCTHT